MSRLRVVFLDHVARLSGGELALLRTLPALLDTIEPIVVLAEDGPLTKCLKEQGIEVHVLPLAATVREAHRDKASRLNPRQALTLVTYIWRLRALLRQLHPDLVHTNSLKSALYGGVAGRLAGIPVIWHIRDRIADDYLPKPMVLLVRLASRILPSAVIANSQTTLNTLPRRGRVLANPVVPDSVVVAPFGPVRPAGPLTVGLVGRLSTWKGQDVLLRAFARAMRGDERLHLVGSAMFGEEEWELHLHALVAELGLEGRVEFRGFREDIWAEYAELDIAVHASTLPEPFGQVVLEAMAAGVPLIAANEGGPAEVVTDGVDGLLVAPRDVDALAFALKKLALDPELRAQLAEKGRITASRYTPEATAEVLLSVYRELARSRRGGVRSGSS